MDKSTHMEGIGRLALSDKQLKIMYSIQRFKVKSDIATEKNLNKKSLKNQWLSEWEEGIRNFYSNQFNIVSSEVFISSESRLREMVYSEIKDAANKTWYYLVILETTLFYPYYPLCEDKKENKKYKGLRFNDKNPFTYDTVKEHGIIEVEFVDRIKKTYKKSISKIKGTTGKIIIATVATIAMTAVSFGLATYFAPQIAVALVGGKFVGLKGMALINACLAYMGGGAIAVGGAGVAGGTLVIAGGGAILGFAVGGTSVGAATALLLTMPNFALTHIAKLEVTLKEIILNAQYDVAYAQEMIDQYKKQIRKYEDLIDELKIKDAKNKDEIKKMQTTIKYMKKAFDEMNKFKSSFEEGVKQQDTNH